jgi:hypothetical protein
MLELATTDQGARFRFAWIPKQTGPIVSKNNNWVKFFTNAELQIKCVGLRDLFGGMEACDLRSSKNRLIDRQWHLILIIHATIILWAKKMPQSLGHHGD